MKNRYRDIEYTEEDFNSLKSGSEEALSFTYVAFYEYVTGILRFKYFTNIDECNDVYADAVLKFRTAIVDNNIVYGNIKAYLLKIAVNILRQNQRDKISMVKKYELFLKDNLNDYELNLDGFDFEEDAKEMTRVDAIKWAMNQLGDLCRNILTDTIVKGFKPSKIFEKYNYKNARVLTDKKVKCKKLLLELVNKKLGEK